MSRWMRSSSGGIVPARDEGAVGAFAVGAGASFVVLHMKHGDPWVYGVLMNNVWSLTSNKAGGSYNNGILQPFVNYNFEGGLYLTSAPIWTVLMFEAFLRKELQGETA